MEDSYRPIRQAALDPYETQLARGGLKPATVEDIEDDLAYAAELHSLQLEVTESDFPILHKGAPDDVLNAIDPAYADRLEMRAPWQPDAETHIVVRMSKRGAGLAVQGTDPEWVRGAFSTMKAEIQRGVPWWGWLRKDAAAVLYAPISALSVGLAVYPFLPRSADRLALGALAMLLGLILGFMLVALAGKVLPGFELLPEGEPGRGRKAVQFVAGVLGQLALALAVSRLG